MPGFPAPLARHTIVGRATLIMLTTLAICLPMPLGIAKDTDTAPKTQAQSRVGARILRPVQISDGHIMGQNNARHAVRMQQRVQRPCPGAPARSPSPASCQMIVIDLQ